MVKNRWGSFLHGLLVWLIIAGTASYCVIRQSGRSGEGEKAADRIGLQGQARYFIGLKSMGLSGSDLLEGAKSAFAANPNRFAILAGELEGPEAARGLLADDETARLLRKLYRGMPMTDEDRQAIRADFGWFGKLALAREDSELHAGIIAESRRTVVTVIALVIGIVAGVLCGLFLLVLVVILALHGHLKIGTDEGHSIIYAEMFALYMVSFLVYGYLASFLIVPGWSLALSGLAALLTLPALAWPLLRGVSWEQICADLGLYSRRPLVDVAMGLGTYVMAIPMLLVGVLVAFLLSTLLKRAGFAPSAPNHPIAGIADGSASWWLWVQVFVVACVIAPVVEEVFFRGALYTHLSRLIPNSHRVARFLIAAAVSSFLFAVIHPQGVLGVPVLGALAGAFCLTREVNGSLLPCMIAHGLNNLVATLLLLLAIA